MKESDSGKGIVRKKSGKNPTDFDREEEYDFFPEYGHIAWRRLKV